MAADTRDVEPTTTPTNPSETERPASRRRARGKQTRELQRLDDAFDSDSGQSTEEFRLRREAYRRYLPWLSLAFFIAIVPIVYLLLGPGRFELDAWRLHQSNLGEIFAAVFGLTLTVVAIVVQLAAQRYSPQIVLHFVRDPVNAIAFVFLVFSSIYVTLLPGFAATGPAARGLAVAGVVLTIATFGLLIPYFVYVFLSVQPEMLVNRLARSTRKLTRRGRARSGDAEELEWIQRDILACINRIADIALSAIENADRDLALRAVRAEQRILKTYLSEKSRFEPPWFDPPESLDAHVAAHVLATMRRDRTWLESTIFFELDHLARRAAANMPELVAQIASVARAISDDALRSDDYALLDVTNHFLNTMLRHSINSGNVRVSYAVLEHYRRAVEAYVIYAPAKALRCANWFVYYGKVANERSLGFVTTTIAHDLRRLSLEAFEEGQASLGLRLVESLLELDETGEGREIERTLLGVRKAQAILAAELLALGLSEAVELIARDFATETPRRIVRVRDELLAVDEAQFWEMTDRGENFEYLAPEQRPFLKEFLDHLGKGVGGRASGARSATTEPPARGGDAGDDAKAKR